MCVGTVEHFSQNKQEKTLSGPSLGNFFVWGPSVASRPMYTHGHTPERTGGRPWVGVKNVPG